MSYMGVLAVQVIADAYRCRYILYTDVILEVTPCGGRDGYTAVGKGTYNRM